MTLTISRILHAGYVFACEDTLIAFDPIFENPFSGNCHAFPDASFDRAQIRSLRPAAVFLSHFHDDHCSLDSLDLLERSTPIYLYCLFDALFSMIRQLGFSTVVRLALDVPVQVGAFTVIARRALDADVDAMFQIQAAGLNVLNVVDAWIDGTSLETLRAFSPWDMVLWPFQTLRETAVLAPSRAVAAPTALPAEWMDELRVLDPRYVVPSSCQFIHEAWSWYNQALFPVTYRQFKREVEYALPATHVLRLNPSMAVTLGANSLAAAAPLSWVLPRGEQDLDYCYDAAAAAPPTSDIARRFAALTAQQADDVLDYCRSGLLERYRRLEPPEDGFFDRPRVWRLSVYAHTGAVTHFHYHLDGERSAALTGAGQALSWTTEIVLAKLYAGLHLGESLTSMYLRINDTVFDPATEADIATADIVDDPLIRCLFDDAFGAYQAAQLLRLTGRTADPAQCAIDTRAM